MKYNFIIISLFLNTLFCFSQVGINTTTPDASSSLDVVSTTQGFLAPRMTEAQRDAISSPAEGLVVYVTDLDGFYFYESTSAEWKEIVNGDNKRDNYVLVKSEADFPAPSAGVITLDENTFYEINGTIVLTNSIELNNAYIAGEDAFEDVLYKASGNLFTGSTGGTVRFLTLSVPAGTIFNLSAAVTENFVMQNCVIANSSSVGSITGYGLLFMNIVQYTGNSAGITFTGTGGNLLLSNIAWLSDNTGTFETYLGTYNLIEKISGFADVPSGSTAIDVSSNPTITTGVIRGSTFMGVGAHVNGYSPAPYSGYYFSDEWDVDSSGIATETDFVAAGSYYLTSATETSVTAVDTPIKFAGTTTATGLLRTSTDGGANNRIKYIGSKTRYFSYVGSLSVIGEASQNNKVHNYYLAKNGSVIASSKQSRKIGTSSDVGSISIAGIVSLSTDDYLELWVENVTDSSNITALSMSLVIK